MKRLQRLTRAIRSSGGAVLCAAALLGGAPALAADDALEFALEGVRAYEAAQAEADRTLRISEFARAEQLFARAAALGPASAELFTNLGNAALQAEHLGSAILAYRRALAVSPSHARADRNLQHARERLPAWVPRPSPSGASDRLFFWMRETSRAERAWGGALAFAAAAALAGLGLALARPALRTSALVPGLAWLALVASLWIEDPSEVGAAGVVIASEATARSSDSAFAASAFAEPLPAGTELRVLEEREGWARIRLSNGRDAWLRSSALARVAPPAAEPG